MTRAALLAVALIATACAAPDRPAPIDPPPVVAELDPIPLVPPPPDAWAPDRICMTPADMRAFLQEQYRERLALAERRGEFLWQLYLSPEGWSLTATGDDFIECLAASGRGKTKEAGINV